jgi:enterochelin esterase-like enzyme
MMIRSFARVLNAARPLSLLLALATPSIVTAQVHAYKPSIEINPDSTVTFHYKDPAATTVLLGIEGVAKPIPMARDASGIWSLTTKPLAPEIYLYHYEVDNQPRLDLANVHVTTNLVNLSNLLTVPAPGPNPAPQLWDSTNVPHGTLHHHTYTTSIVVGLPGNQSDFYVYTPPGYDPKSKKPYPVLYLLHGWGDAAPGWTAVGQAHWMLDNLLAQGKIKPMVVVMPLGYGDMSFINSFSVWNDPVPVAHNTTLFTQALLTEVLPQVEASYNVSHNREDRAITGFSMGGLEALYAGLTHTDQFAWIGGFSSAVHNLDYPTELATLDPKSANLRLLWVACGTTDGLITANRKLVTFLKAKNMPVTQIETPGPHVWQVWRDNFANFLPLLFQTPSPQLAAQTK